MKEMSAIHTPPKEEVETPGGCTVTDGDVEAILAAGMPDGCTVGDYLEDALPGKDDLAALGISTEGYGMSDIRADIHRDFYRVLVKAVLSAATDFQKRQIGQAVAVERERCAMAAEGEARDFDFQKAQADCDDVAYGWNSARLAVSGEIRAGSEPLAIRAALRVKPLDESRTTGWTDDKDRFCLPLSCGYYIKFPKREDNSPIYMAWFHNDPVAGSSSFKDTVKIAQDHHQHRIRQAVELEYAPAPGPVPGIL